MALENIGARIRSIRKARGLTQEALARRADLSLNQVARLELGMVENPFYRTLDSLAQALDVSVEELVEEESTPPKASALHEAGHEVVFEATYGGPRAAMTFEEAWAWVREKLAEVRKHHPGMVSILDDGERIEGRVGAEAGRRIADAKRVRRSTRGRV